MAYIEKLRKSAGVAKTLQASKEMARKLGISATPAIIIDGTLVAGWNEKEIQKLLS
ncbi:thioredoxin-like protein [Novosphingobium sp. PhB55]|nr:thioredoxin-like protein [Novosphingobium sp. PhB55]